LSRIHDLIDELCPDGVPYKLIGDIATVVRGASPRPIQNFITGDEDGVPWIKIGNVPAGGKYITHTAQRITSEGAAKSRRVYPGDFVLSNSMSFGRPYITKIEGCIHDGWLAISDFSESFVADFLYHLLGSPRIQEEFARRAGVGAVQNLNADIVKAVTLPVPPLEVQREIAQALDLFGSLEAELQDELQARRLQFVRYRDSLLALGDESDAMRVTLPDISLNLDSRRKPVTKSAREPGSIPYYGASGVVDYVSEYIFDGDYLLVSEDGANLLARSTPIAFSITGKTWVNNHAHILEFRSYAERRFVEIYLNSIGLASFVTGGAQPKLNQANLNKIPIPAPSLAEQERIVDILDKFDALMNDPGIGISAELNARRKQYQYYRDRLLKFEGLAV
jgi:type I restriction enzyme S subunit